MTRTEKTYYLVFGCYNASWSFVAAVYALFLLDRGLDLLQINLVLATYFVGSFLFEVPTGAVADLCGRKTSFLLSCAVRATAFFLYFFADSLSDFIVAEMIDAVGSALASGALDAWAVDGMRAEGDERPSDRFFARSRMLAHASIIVSGCVGAYLGQGDLALPWLAGALGFALTFIVALTFMHRDAAPAPGAGRGEAGQALGWGAVMASSRASLRAQIGDGVGVVLRHPVLRGVCALTFVTAFAQMPFVHYWQPHMLAKAGGATWVMGWIWALLGLAALLGSAVVERLAGRVGRAKLVAMSSVVRAVSVLAAAWSPRFSSALAGIVVQAGGTGVSEPLLGAWVNENVGAAQRATVLSVYAMSFTAGASAGLLSLGYLANSYGIPVVWSIAALVFALAAGGALAVPRERAPASAVEEIGLALDEGAARG